MSIVKILEKLLKDRKFEKTEEEREVKRLQETVRERGLKVRVDKELRNTVRKIGDKKSKSRRKRTSVDGDPKHSHLYTVGDSHTGITDKHKHKISKNGKTALAGSTRHTHKLK